MPDKIESFDEFCQFFQTSFKPKKEDGSKYPCPVCKHITLDERGGYEVCPVCFWEDDGTDEADLDNRFSPNHMTLRQGRENYKRIGACEERLVEHVRSPLPEEIPHEIPTQSSGGEPGTRTE